MSQERRVVIDGRTGEGGGQVVRVAVGLAALTGTPIIVHNVRGNRPGKRGGGLKAQHVAGIQCLADCTDAETSGVHIGSSSFEFRAKLSPSQLRDRNIHIKADSAASILLVFQTILPFLIFAGNTDGKPVTLTITGGTNVSFSLSFEYLDQVLLPSLERFGLHVERTLNKRGWSHGPKELGSILFKFTPLPPGLSFTSSWPDHQGSIQRIDVSLITSMSLQEPLQNAIVHHLGLVFPGISAVFKVLDDSKHPARVYALLVLTTSTGLKFGRDWLYDESTKRNSTDTMSTRIAQKVVNELNTEFKRGGVVDEYLQDQLVVFQALAIGRSCIPVSAQALSSSRERVDRTDEPFGDGSMHTTTARWVASLLLPQTRWIDSGRVCEGAGWKVKSAGSLPSIV